MSVQVMFSSSAVFLFMLLLTCCSSGGVVCAEEVKSVSEPSSVELFKKVDTMLRWSRKRVTFFRAHSLVDVNGLMVAFAEANSNCDELCCVAELLSKSLKYEKGKLPSEIIKKEDGNQWMMQAAATNKRFCTGLFGPSAVVKDNKIYVLLSMIVGLRISNFSSAFLEDLELVVGTVATPTDGSPNRITWQPSNSLKNTLKDKMPFRSSREDLFALVGRGIVMGGSTILFPLALQNMSLGGNLGCTVIYSEDDGDNWNFPPGKIIDKDCRHATLLEWEGKLVMIPIPSSSSRTRKVHVSADKGKTWTEDGESGPSLLVDFLIRAMSGVENGMTTATINGKNLTLLSQPVISSGSGAHNQVHLFMTDNRRITSVGPISLDKDIRLGCKLLYTKENGELFALCDKGSRYSPESVVLLSLTEQLERIKSVLETWEITDEKVSKICISATKDARCSTAPTTGLIGFLSNTSDDAHWADEYLGVNATVTGGAKVENGFKLSGSCAKVEWRFGGQEQNQLYSFADRGLTLVATVTINDIPESDTLLMTVGLTSKTVGLWYGKDGEWKGLRDDDGKENTSWEKGKPYQVVITVLNGAGSVYIDGKRLGSLEPNFRSDKDGKARRRRGVSHELKEEVRLICFGGCVSVHNGDGINAGSSFTVTNVFLYNRVLNATELLPPQQEQEQSQFTAEGTIERTITGNSTDEEQTEKPPQQEKDHSQPTGEETGEATTTGNSTDEEQTDTAPAGKNSSVHESLSSLFQLFSLLVFLGSATL